MKDSLYPFVYDYLEWEIKSESGVEEILDWYCNEKDLLRFEPHKFYPGDLKGNMGVFDIFLVKKYNKNLFTISGENCRDLFKNLPKLYKNGNKKIFLN